MTDIRGKQLKVGDKVIILRYGKRPNPNKIGKVIGFTDCTVKVQTAEDNIRVDIYRKYKEQNKLKRMCNSYTNKISTYLIKS